MSLPVRIVVLKSHGLPQYLNHTQVEFGEGPNYAGPGNIWVSHEIDD